MALGWPVFSLKKHGTQAFCQASNLEESPVFVLLGLPGEFQHSDLFPEQGQSGSLTPARPIQSECLSGDQAWALCEALWGTDK